MAFRERASKMAAGDGGYVSRTRVFPHSSDDIDMSVSSVGFRGAALSSVNETELETQRNRMTLEEARWTGVRKKVPGMSGLPKQTRTRSGLSAEEEYDPYAKHMSELRTFIRQHFRQKECSKFVPKPGQNVKRIRDLRCHCGETLPEHAGMQGPFDHFSSAEMMEEYLVPKELREIMSRRNDTLPVSMPPVEWKPDCIRPSATCTYGKINFENVEHAGGKKPAKYIRMTDDDSVDNLMELMEKHWHIMEPERPNLVISVVGGAKNFKLDGRMRDTFSGGLIKAAKTTSAWLISSGFNMGVMKSVGQAVRQGQSFCWDNNRMAHVLRCIGIAPWGYVKNRRQLESIDGQGKFNANFRTSNVILHNAAVPLNPDHTHFIFVDDGYRIRYAGVAGIRAKLEQKISQPQAEGGLGIPVVLVVVEGGTDCINDARTSLQHKIPVVVCAGTGRAADILAYAYSHTKSSAGGQRVMKEKHELKLMDKIYEAYGKNWKEEEIEKKTNEIKDSVQICCQDPEMLTVFYMNKHEDLDLAILSVLLKAKKGADEEQRLSQLKLALTWDRVDIAQEEIFREDVLWSTGSLDDVLTEALLKNKVKFVELILQQGVVMKEYLTVERLEKLYLEVPKHNYLYKLLHRLVGLDQLNLENIRLLLLRLLDRYDTHEETVLKVLDNGTVPLKQGDLKNARFQRPYKMLLVWAILMHRQPMAKLFWELGEEPITSALAASRIYHAMAKNLPRHESNLKTTLQQFENDFEQLATAVLDECHHKDPDKAMMIAERKSPCWNQMTCLQIAAAASDQVFLASVTCQSSINMIWKHGILASPFKIALGMIFPPFLMFGLEIMNLGETQLSGFQKLGVFYSSPLSKFSHGMLMYVIFLLLHSYMVLVDFSPSSVTPLEWVIVLWIIAFFVDEIHTFIAFPSPTIKSKVRDWYDFFKWLDVFNFILAFIGFIVHWSSGYYLATKVIYCINSIIFFLRILKIYIVNGDLGPKIFMIRRMLQELRMFIMVLLVFLLAYGVSSQGLLYHLRNPSWSVLRDVFYYPYWQLYGEIYLEELDTGECVAGSSDCKTFHWLVPFLLAGYLLVGNILLLNLLIAIFSHVFQQVEDNSIEIWKYQMYFLVMEYENKTFLVPPFSIFQHIFLAVRWVIRKTCLRHESSKQHYSKRHLEYLQLFEKEMMMNYLRQVKSEQMSGIETTVSSLQKRVDELTKLIEDEVIADQQPNLGLGQTAMIIDEEQLRKISREGSWPDGLPTLNTMTKLDPVIEEDQEDRKEKKKKHKHKKKKKHRHEEKEELIEEKETNLNDKININTINLPPNIPSEPSKPDPTVAFNRRNSERGLLPKFKPPEDSDTGTDNALQGVMKLSPRVSTFGRSGFEGRQSEEFSPRSQTWKPKTRVKDNQSDDKSPPRKPPRSPGRARFSNEVVDIQDVSSEEENFQPRSRRSTGRSRFSNEAVDIYNLSSDDSASNSRRSFSKLKKKKQKRSLRNLSDSDDI